MKPLSEFITQAVWVYQYCESWAMLLTKETHRLRNSSVFLAEIALDVLGRRLIHLQVEFTVLKESHLFGTWIHSSERKDSVRRLLWEALRLKKIWVINFKKQQTVRGKQQTDNRKLHQRASKENLTADIPAKLTMKKTDLKNEVIGCFLALFSTMCFTLGSVSVQALDGYIPDFELNVIRLSGMLIFFFFFLMVWWFTELLCFDRLWSTCVCVWFDVFRFFERLMIHCPFCLQLLSFLSIFFISVWLPLDDSILYKLGESFCFIQKPKRTCQTAKKSQQKNSKGKMIHLDKLRVSNPLLPLFHFFFFFLQFLPEISVLLTIFWQKFRTFWPIPILNNLPAEIWALRKKPIFLSL